MLPLLHHKSLSCFKFNASPSCAPTSHLLCPPDNSAPYHPTLLRARHSRHALFSAPTIPFDRVYDPDSCTPHLHTHPSVLVVQCMLFYMNAGKASCMEESKCAFSAQYGAQRLPCKFACPLSPICPEDAKYMHSISFQMSLCEKQLCRARMPRTTQLLVPCQPQGMVWLPPPPPPP